MKICWQIEWGSHMPPNYPAGIHCDLPIYFWYLDPAHDFMSISCQTSARYHQKPGLACMDNSLMVERDHKFSAGPQKNGSGFRCRSQPFAGCELAPSVLGLQPPQSGMNLSTSFLKAGDLGWSWLLVRFGRCLHQNGIKYPVVADCGKGTLLLHPFVATNSIHSFLDLS